MKKIQVLLLMFAVALLGFSASLRAEDIDLYVDNANTAGTPNVLFVIDTGANFSSNAAIPCTAYASGGAPSLGGTAGGVEQCALVDAIQSLASGSVNIGIMVNNNNNFATDVRSTGDAAWHRTCGGTYGGCLVRPLALMDDAGKASLVNFIKSWKTSGSNSATEFNVKSGGDRTANMMQESWAYYNGKIGMSGTNYSTSVTASGCQKNFIIFIGNAFNTSGTPGDGGSESPYNGTNAMTSAQVGATAAQKQKITQGVSFNPATCGVTSAAAGSNASDWSENWADEWARLMFEQDGGANNAEGAQNIVTYTIGVVNDNQCKPDYPALLSSMAQHGGGKYFKTSSAVDVKLALDTILNEVQAVNSVFSSASLPVSVDGQGTYLNQIFLGMFRPDATGAPRWLGNLKQYQLVKNDSNVTVLGDADGKPAISSAGTGFISPTARSFWTYKDEGNLPDSAGGFFKNDLKGVTKSAFDSPDGEVVEKGGVAQQLRKENLTATFTGADGTSSNPRRLYTYCPAGASCNAALTDASNEFSTANGSIAANAFGESTTVKIASIVRTGGTALVTTVGNHGFTSGTSVTVSGADQVEYNVTQSITPNSSNTFTITGLTEFPVTPTTGGYYISSQGGAPISVVSITRSTSTLPNTFETATVTTSTPHGFTSTTQVQITGASPSQYQFIGTVSSVVSPTVFTYPVAIEPPATAVNTYQAALSPTAYPARSVTLTRPSNGVAEGTTTAAHGFWVGMSITVSGAAETRYNTTATITSIPSATTFRYTISNGNAGSSSGSVQPDMSAKPVTLTRNGTDTSATATAAGAPANFFGGASGSTRVLNITKTGGSATNETAYLASNLTVTCANATCTQFTYPISVTPSISASGTIQVAVAGSSFASVGAGAITRTGTTATVTGVPSGTFTNSQTLVIAPSGSAKASEAAYVGTWQISCVTAGCTSFTFGPVTVTPTSPATGANMIAHASSSPPDRDTIIRWVRGQDNRGDELGPGGTVTVRPSVHGDVLHSRPVVVNYGDSRGIVVYYGANDGVFRAVNGNKTGNISSVPPGGELWGVVFREQYSDLTRLRINTPELKFPSTTLPSAQPKDYFIDGPIGVYQKLAADGTIDKAYVYVTMRRGGRFIYAIDVTTPSSPQVLWTLDPSKNGFEELGQTWSRPRVAVVPAVADPVLIFGGGYDAAQDAEPPTANSMGRGVFIINALTGEPVWRALNNCTYSGASAPAGVCVAVPGMDYAIASEVSLVDRLAEDRKTDKVYVGDLGGNVWRADIGGANVADWTMTRLAALGCEAGACASGITPRKFFFPPGVINVLTSGAAGSYDVVALASGDREHPLKNTATGSAYNVTNRFFMIKDTGTTSTPMASTVTVASLTQIAASEAGTPYNGTGSGFYFNLATGEKGVNAATVNDGFIFFGTNRPVDRSATCAANLGEAKAYAVDPFGGNQKSNTLAGGGMPPSAVSGLYIREYTDGQGQQQETLERFCLGCGVQPPGGGGGGGGGGSDCNSALGNCTSAASIPRNMRRTYWYKK